jgi:hypothetical protein
MKRINHLSQVITIIELSLIKIIRNHIEVEGEESSFLLILGDRPVGGLSVGGCLSIFSKNFHQFHDITM